MEPNATLAPHEMMEVHELFNMKTTGLAKAKAIDGMVTDKDLKVLIEEDIAQSMQDLQDLQPYVELARTQMQQRQSRVSQLRSEQRQSRVSQLRSEQRQSRVSQLRSEQRQSRVSPLRSATADRTTEEAFQEEAVQSEHEHRPWV